MKLFVLFSILLFALVCEINGTPVSKLELECPLDETEGSIAKIFPHESDCTKFYICEKGHPTEMNCAPGLLFNPEISVCDWEENVTCSHNEIPAK